ncbi:hypothetical protein KEM48_012520 [Puccinia striiformis f. sp. tritici PST-130]|nr:hypothetical protein KEM48_012520 [Puccinia striiformis f. sp. tritici PST-130]
MPRWTSPLAQREKSFAKDILETEKFPSGGSRALVIWEDLAGISASTNNKATWGHGVPGSILKQSTTLDFGEVAQRTSNSGDSAGSRTTCLWIHHRVSYPRFPIVAAHLESQGSYHRFPVIGFLIIGSDMLKQLVLLSFWYVFVGSGVDAHPMNRALVKDGTVDSAFHLDVPVSTREFHGIGGVRSPGETSDELVDHGLIVSDQAHPLIGPVSPGHTTEGNTRLRDLLATVKSSKMLMMMLSSLEDLSKVDHQSQEIRLTCRGVDTLWNKHSQITERFVTGPNSGMLTSDRMAILDEAQERIGVLQQLKLLEIEKITPNIANRQLVEEIFRFGPTPAKRLNLDSIDLSSKEEVQRLVNLHLEEVKKLLLPHTYNPKLSDRFIEPPSEKEIRQYWFYTVDFLLDNNFITEQDLLGSPIQELDQFLEAFQIEKYLKNLDYSNKPKNSFVGSADNLGLSLTISEILNFIENELYAGLVKEAALELLGDEEKVKQFEDKAQLILNYFEFFKIHALPAASGAIKFTMQDKKEKLLKVFTIFNQVAHRILNRNDDWSRQIDGVLRLKSVLEVVEQLNRQMHLEENIRDVPPMSSRAKEVSEHAFSMAMTTSAISGALGAVSELTR